MKINKKELLKLGTPKPVPTIKAEIKKYLKKRGGGCTRAKLYEEVRGTERSIRRACKEMCKDGIVSERYCECNLTRFIQLL